MIADNWWGHYAKMDEFKEPRTLEEAFIVRAIAPRIIHEVLEKELKEEGKEE